MLLLPTPVGQTAQGYSAELCKRSRPVTQILTFVFPAFTLNPFFSMASFHIKSLLTHFSRKSAMMTRSSAYRSSQGTPTLNSCDKASSTMMKSKGLSMDPWWTRTFTLYRDANHYDFCGIIPIFKANFRITIFDVKIRQIAVSKMIPDKIKEVTSTCTPIWRKLQVGR